MLTIYRRHQKKCEHRDKCRSCRRCLCMIWVDGTVGGVEIRKSLHTRNWQKAQDIVRQWEADGKQNTKSKQSDAPVTVDQAWQDFLSDMEARNLNVSTVRKYKLLSRRMQDFAARRGLRFIAQFDLVTLRSFREE